MNTDKKIKLFLFGGCDLFDIVKNDQLQRDFNVIDYSIDRKQTDNTQLTFDNRSVPEMGTSIISLYTKPGQIAQRTLDIFSAETQHTVLFNKHIYDEILKFPYFDFYRKNAGPNDYLLISFSPEIYTKFFRAGECFSCVPAMYVTTNPESKFHWLYTEFFSKDEYLMPFDTKESLEWSFDLMPDFARDIFEIFQDRVILVKTHFSNFVISSDYKIKNIKVGPDQLLFYKQTKIVSDPTDHNYAERLSLIIMNKFIHHYSSNLSLIKLNEPVFIDANHRWGYSQFHIDLHSRNKIAKLIHEDLLKKLKHRSPTHEYTTHFSELNNMN